MNLFNFSFLFLWNLNTNWNLNMNIRCLLSLFSISCCLKRNCLILFYSLFYSDFKLIAKFCSSGIWFIFIGLIMTKLKIFNQAISLAKFQVFDFFFFCIPLNCTSFSITDFSFYIAIYIWHFAKLSPFNFSSLSTTTTRIQLNHLRFDWYRI